MQSHTFSKARGVPIVINGSASAHHLHQASTSHGRPPRSTSLNLRAKQREEEARAKEAAGLPKTFTPRFHNEGAVRRMRYNRLGRTDMVVSQCGLGCGALGGLFGDVTDSIQTIVDSSLREGINIIDTAYWYGKERSESILGKVLSDIPRSAYYICTKIGRFELDFVRNFDYRADKVLDAVMESLKRLRLTYIDIIFLQIHDVEYDKYERMVLFETLQALEMAKQSGKVRYIGATGYSLDKLGRLFEAAPVPIDVVMSYTHGTLNDNSLGRYIPFFQSRGVGVINSSPLSMGLLTHCGPPPWHPSSQIIKETIATAVNYCAEKHIEVERLALDYSFRFPGCSSCFVSIDSLARMRSILDIAIGDAPLTQTEHRVRDRIMRRYLDSLDNAGWEGIDTAAYWKRLKKLGLSSLATNRHSSVESLASTLNGMSMRSTTSSSDLASLRPHRRTTPSRGGTSLLSGQNGSRFGLSLTPSLSSPARSSRAYSVTSSLRAPIPIPTTHNNHTK
ncbi:mec-14 [Pristionchus pacificus]|uniref:Mec-14 n=1 Tax=Pristionchus pacificus TaxID=54126 RepID=A0A2A6BJG2_PRIPA|nr:mec-14 [Pristionchus pacificus]|eukprot:PDM65983.1 mec-14 [Pristionchus pacificus]